MEFNFDHTAFLSLLAALAGFYLLLRIGKRFSPPQLSHPDLAGLKKVGQGWRLPFAKLPRYLLYLSLCLFAVAIVDPRLLIPRQGVDAEAAQGDASEGIALYFLLDQSGSMADTIVTSDEQGNREKIPKIQLLKEVTKAFVKKRPNDMIGIVALARGATVISPLTLDHKDILNKIEKLPVLTDPDQGGTVIGYGIFKTANLIAATHHFADELAKEKQLPSYSIKSNVIILVTDGLQDPNPLDEDKPLRTMEIPEAAEYARQAGVKLYIISIDPALGQAQFTGARNQMKHAAESTGGRYYLLQGSQGLAQVYSEIDKLEKSALPTLASQQKELQPHLYRALFLYPYLVAFGIAALLASLLLESTLLRRVP